MAITVADLLTRFSADTSNLDTGVSHANQQISRFQSTTSGMFGSLSSVGSLALGVAGGGLIALGAGLFGAGSAGLSMNREMENVTAQLNAFTKDGAKSAEILEMIRERAAKTPFEFNEMAKATAGLLPAAKASGAQLESLVEQAEILAASNPAQGLEGAAFALREAVSGDFTSIIERFNLPRSYINKLKEEGVPALEIVSKAMAQVGFDTDLVANLAETADGRWSTFKDTFVSFAATITQPIFDSFSAGLGNVNAWLSENEPLLNQVATAISTAVTGAVEGLIARLPSADVMLTALTNGFLMLIDGVSLAWQWLNSLITTLAPFVSSLVAMIAPIVQTVSQFVSWQDVLAALGIAIAAVVIPAIVSFVAAMAPIIATVALVIAAVSLLRNAWENDWGGIQSKVAAVWGWLQPVFESLYDWFESVLPDVIAFYVEIFTAEFAVIQTVLELWWTAVSTIWQTVSDWLTVTLPDAVTTLKNDWSTGWEGVKTSTATQWASIRTSFDSMKTWLDSTLPTSVTGFGTSSETSFESIKNSIVGKFDTVIATFKSVQTWLNDTLQDALDSFKNALSGLTFSNPFQSIVNAIEAVPDAISSAKTTISNFVTWLSSLRIPDIFAMLNLPDWLQGLVGSEEPQKSRSGSRSALAGASTTALALPVGGGGVDVDTLAAAIVRAFAQAPPVVRAEFTVNMINDPAAVDVSYQMARRVSEIIQRRTI